MSFIYTQEYLLARINAGIQNKKGLLLDTTELCNELVREVKTEIKLRSAKRKTSLVPNLYREEFEYACPSDMDGFSIIDIPQQAQRADGEFNLVPVEQFTRRHLRGDISISDYNGVRTLLIDSRVNSDTVIIDNLSQITNGVDAWTEYGDAENLEVNTDDFVRANGSLEFDINASAGTTAGIQSSNRTVQDYSKYINHAAAAFLETRITSVTGITNYKLRLETSGSDYYEFTVTQKNDGTAFSVGWNLLRFDMLSYTTVGTPDSTNISGVKLFMTKTTGKINEAGYMFNYLVLKKGKYADVLYYSKFGWQSPSGTYKESSDSVTDLLVADTDEFDLFVKKGRALAVAEADVPLQDIQKKEKAYTDAKTNYQLRNPDESKIIISSYYEYGSRDGYVDLYNTDHGQGNF